MFLLSILILLPSICIAQRSGKGSKTRTKISKQVKAVTAKLSVLAAPAPGMGEVALENYTGSPLKGIQFHVIAASMNPLESVNPGNSVSDKELYSVFTNIVPGTTNDFGKRTDTIKVVVFGNGRTVFPSGNSIKFLTINYQQPIVTGTSADTVGFKITNVMAGLPNAKGVDITVGPEVFLNLWK